MCSATVAEWRCVGNAEFESDHIKVGKHRQGGEREHRSPWKALPWAQRAASSAADDDVSKTGHGRIVLRGEPGRKSEIPAHGLATSGSTLRGGESCSRSSVARRSLVLSTCPLEKGLQRHHLNIRSN